MKICGRSWRVLGELDRDESGTSLTEFVIILPIFVMMMLFIYHIGSIGNAITLERGEAQRDLWGDVAAVQIWSHGAIDDSDPMQIYTNPSRAAQQSREHLLEYGPREQVEGYLAEEVGRNQERTYQGLGSGGHWGESHQRVQPAEGRMNLFLDGRRATGNLADVVGGSEYARRLVNDGSGGSNIDYIVNRGLPTVLGAGIRYGSIHAVREREVRFNHEEYNVEVRSEYNLLAPPSPPFNAERWATEITGQQVRSFRAYDDLAGIARQQPVRGESALAVPDTWSSPMY